MKRNLSHTNRLWGALIMLCCIVLASCKNEADMLQTLNDLKKNWHKLTTR